MRRPSVAAVGDNTIDRYSDGSVLVGGNALNVAVQARLAGVPAAYFGAIGRDEDGALIAAALRANQVAADGLVAADGPTAVTQIRLTPDGDRVFEREDFGVTAEYEPSDADLALIARHAWVHIGMLPRAAAFVRRLRAIAPSIHISQDCAVAHGFAHLDVAFCSAGEDERAAIRVARDAVRRGASLAVATRGAAG
ncbi:MAG: PfkB family carbohydrate kinase, partial [Microbacterium sp.]|uniref:PfkB family carbohydrate kinase n=1 Tax=Microbacterium sp. TaxID=51671 RepID=UPI0039E4CF56